MPPLRKTVAVVMLAATLSLLWCVPSSADYRTRAEYYNVEISR